MSRIPAARALGLAVIAALALAACKGKGSNDTLADGATDANSAATGATATGPGAPPVSPADPVASTGATGVPGNAGAAAPGPMLVLVPDGPHGPYLTNAAGNALYYVEGDEDGRKCVGPCIQSWPPVLADTQQPTGAAGLQGAAISVITRPDGTRQVTFEGHPLYRYAADAGVGQANGDGVKDKFGSWHVAMPGAGGDSSDAAAAGATSPSGN
ncbi:COG4315 family predicted lipoprotein [Lysobacter claricitrinus]|uniref:COG4315 family predicted lipoprotein n=1 Tax=Lysobacter claricitrinus TaxID=3367728 RepID=UPI0038B3ACB1